MIRYLIIAIFAFFFSIYCFEIFLTYQQHSMDNEREIKQNEATIHKTFDRRKRIEVFNELRKSDKDITITTHAGFLNDNFYSLSGPINSNTIFCNESGAYTFYKSDRYGFNNPDNEWDENEIEYLLIGDSYTHGACVNRPYDIASVIRKLSGKSVINLGYEGNGPLKEYVTLREYLPRNSNKIIWIAHEYDLYNLKNNLNDNILNKYLDDPNFSQELKKKNKILSLAIKKKIDNLFIEKNLSESSNIKKNIVRYKENTFSFIKLLKSRRVLINNHNSPLKEDIFDEFKNIVKLIKKKADKYYMELYFVLLPDYSRYTENYYNAKNFDRIKNIVQNEKINFIDIDDQLMKFEKNPKDLYALGIYNHNNEYGYKRISEVILEHTK